MTKVTTTKVTQTANEILGTEEKTLYYMIVETEKGKYVMNIGEKSFSEIKRLTEEETKTEKISDEKGPIKGSYNIEEPKTIKK